jgi:adenine-specific DNA-methyltransferase
VLNLSYAIQQATIELNRPPSFGRLAEFLLLPEDEDGALAKVFAMLNQLRPRKRYFSRNFSESSGRLYFSDRNAGRIDAVREQITEWESEGCLESAEKAYLLTGLLEAADRVANTAGTYYAHLKQVTRKAAKELEMTPPLTFDNGFKNRCRLADARTLTSSTTTDILYLDPPYNSRDYAAYYHLAETLVLGDGPLPAGKSGSPATRRGPLSDFCRPSTASSALDALVSRANARYVLVHYTPAGLVSHSAIMRMLKDRGRASFRDIPVRAYSARADDAGVTNHRIYWCEVEEGRRLDRA